jgi:hypothetical protein
MVRMEYVRNTVVTGTWIIIVLTPELIFQTGVCLAATWNPELGYAFVLSWEEKRGFVVKM